MLSSLSLLGFVLLQISTSRASPAGPAYARAVTTTAATSLPNSCTRSSPSHSKQSNAPSSPYATLSTQAPASPHYSLINIQPRDDSSSSTTVSSYSGNLLITFAPITTTNSEGSLTTIPASTPSGQPAVATPYPPPPAPPTSGLSIGAKAAIGSGAVVACIFFGFFLCCVYAQTRQRRSRRLQDANGQPKDANVLTDLQPIPAQRDHKYAVMVNEARQPSPGGQSFMTAPPNQSSADPYQAGLPRPISRFPSHHSTRRPVS
jgi:hypothetical protein